MSCKKSCAAGTFFSGETSASQLLQVQTCGLKQHVPAFVQRPPLEAPHVCKTDRRPWTLKNKLKTKNVNHVHNMRRVAQNPSLNNQNKNTFAHVLGDAGNSECLLHFLHSCLTMLWSPYVLGTRTLLWLGNGCSGHRMFWEHERYYGLGMGALVLVCFGNTNVIPGHRMLWEHKRYSGLGMGALVTVCSGNTNVIMVKAWVLWSPYALGTRTSETGVWCTSRWLLLLALLLVLLLDARPICDAVFSLHS